MPSLHKFQVVLLFQPLPSPPLLLTVDLYSNSLLFFLFFLFLISTSRETGKIGFVSFFVVRCALRFFLSTIQRDIGLGVTNGDQILTSDRALMHAHTHVTQSVYENQRVSLFQVPYLRNMVHFS